MVAEVHAQASRKYDRKNMGWFKEYLQESNALLGLGVEEGDALLEALLVCLPGLQQLCFWSTVSVGQGCLQLRILSHNTKYHSLLPGSFIKQYIDKRHVYLKHASYRMFAQLTMLDMDMRRSPPALLKAVRALSLRMEVGLSALHKRRLNETESALAF